MLQTKNRAYQLLNGLGINLEKLLNSRHNHALFDEVLKYHQEMDKDLNILNEKAFYKALIDYLEQVQRQRLIKFRQLKSKENDLCEVLDESCLSASEGMISYN